MKEFPDFYATLGIGPDASQDEVKHAWRDHVREWHPDKHASGAPEVQKAAEEKTIRINRAYEVLRDPKQRAAYTSDWRLWKQSGQRPPPKQPAGGVNASTFEGILQILMGALHAPVDVTRETSDGQEFIGGLTLVQGLANLDMAIRRQNEVTERLIQVLDDGYEDEGGDHIEGLMDMLGGDGNSVITLLEKNIDIGKRMLKSQGVEIVEQAAKKARKKKKK